MFKEKSLITFFLKKGLLFIIFSVPFFINAQNQERIDELWKQNETAVDTQVVNNLVTIAREYIGFDNEKGLEISQQAYRYADSIGFKKGMPKAKGFIGLFYDFLGQKDTALYLYKVTAREFEEVGNLLWASYSYRNVGIEYQDKSNYVLALNYMLKSLAIREQLKDTTSIIQIGYSIAFLHDRLGNDQEAVNLHKKNLELATLTQDSFYIAKIHQGIGIGYDDLGNYDLALEYNQKALELSQAIMDKENYESLYEVTTNKGNIGNNYIHLGNYPLALKYTLEAYKEDSTNNVLQGLVNKAINLGFIYTKLGDFKNAKRFLDEGYQMAYDLQINQRVLEVHDGYYEYYFAKGDYKRAAEWLRKYSNLKDSTFNDGMTQQFAEMRTEFDLVRKEQQLSEKEFELKEQEIIIERNRAGILALALFIVVGLIGGVLFVKRKQYILRLSHEKERTKLKSEQVEAVILSQEKERKRFAMDLHDDFGQLISALKLNVANESKKEVRSKSEEILDSMYTSLKNIAFDLMPHTLFEKGLEEAIDELKDQVNSSG
ncbi:MAG: tetratricopeptide repeat protein [Cyclobacteriaceae bacterium]|nr:tetratricopeptide repeat protein [Cyclobacteriaceae bacterium HetDA_MAG_MS6]